MTRTINLQGPEGNAFVVMATASDLLRRQGKSKEEIDAVITDAISDDYDNLLDVIAEACGGKLGYMNR